MTTFEVVQTIFSFGTFTVAVIGLCDKIFKDNGKKLSRPHFWLSRRDYHLIYEATDFLTSLH